MRARVRACVCACACARVVVFCCFLFVFFVCFFMSVRVCTCVQIPFTSSSLDARRELPEVLVIRVYELNSKSTLAGGRLCMCVRACVRVRVCVSCYVRPNTIHKQLIRVPK